MAATAGTTTIAQSSPAQVQQPTPAPKLVTPDEESLSSESSQTKLLLLDGAFTVTPSEKPALESWFSGVDLKCVGCHLFDPNAVRPESTSPNAPWMFQGKWRRHTAIGLLSAGVLGVRNFAIAPSVGTPIGGDFDPGPLGTSSTAFVGPTSQWSVTAAFEKTAATFAGGATVSFVADVILPVTTTSAVAGDPRIGTMSSRTIRGGITFRW